MIIIKFGFNLLIQDSTLKLTTILLDIKNKYFNNSTNNTLSKVLNNQAYCFKINKEIST